MFYLSEREVTTVNGHGPLEVGDRVCCTWIDPQSPVHEQPIGATGVVVEVRPSDPCFRALDLLRVRCDDTGEVFGYVAFEVTRVDQVGYLVTAIASVGSVEPSAAP